MTYKVETGAATNMVSDGRSDKKLTSREDRFEEVRKSGVLGLVLETGDQAPDFTLPDHSGESVSLARLQVSGPVVVTFFRGVWCPYCNADLVALEKVAGRVRDYGATLIAISPQSTANSRKPRRENNLSFSILSDAGNQVAADFGLRYTVAPDEQEDLTRYGVTLPAFNGDDSWTLPIPARFVVRRDGMIVYAEADPDHKRRPDPGEVLAVLDRLAVKAG